jgi:hypothetical protein
MGWRDDWLIVDDVKGLADALVAAVRALQERYGKVCLEAGNANTRIYQVLRDEGPLHFYEVILRSGLPRTSVQQGALFQPNSRSNLAISEKSFQLGRHDCV